MMGQYKRFASNTLFLTIGSFSSKALSFLLVPLYTAILTTEEYGTYDLIITTVTLLTPFLTLVIAEGVMRFCLDTNKYDSRHILSIGLFVVGIGSVLFTAFFPVFRNIETLSQYYLWIWVFFIASNVHLILTQYLKGINRIKLYTSCGVLSTFLTLILNILFLVVFDWRITGYMLSYVLAHVCVSIFIMVKIRIWNLLVNPFKISRQTYKEILRYTIPMVPNSMSWWVNNSSDKYIITWLLSTSALGIYSVAYKIPSLLTVFTGIFTSAFQISAVEDFGSEKSKKFFENMYVMFASLNVSIAVVLIVLAKPLAFVLFQKEFFRAWEATTVLLFAYLFNFLAGILGTVYTSAKKTSFIFTSTIVGAVVNIILNVILIRIWGIIGAAVATLLSYMCVWMLRVINVRKILDFNLHLGVNSFSYLLVALEIVLVLKNSLLGFILATVIALVILVINCRVLYKSELMAGVRSKLFSKFRR